MDRCLTIARFWAVFLFLASCQFSKTDSSYPWLVYYGARLERADLQGIRLAILDPDQVVPKKFNLPNTKFIGYLSLGEAESYRSYWHSVVNRPFLVEPNPDWQGAYRVDARSQEWRELVLHRLIPEIFSKGYDGLFLDTVDTAAYLEEKNPEKYKGSREAMVQLVKEIRKLYPDKMILPNNGLEMLEGYADAVDGIVVEDLYTRYDFSLKKSIPTPLEIQQQKEKILDRFINQYHKPVFNILYETDPRSQLARHGIQRSREKGYRWYLTEVDLQSLP